MVEEFDRDRRSGYRPQIVGCIINRKQEILMAYTAKYDLWGFPQGGILNEENLGKAIMREIDEEMGEGFMGRCKVPDRDIIVAKHEVRFPPELHGSRILTTDKGDRVTMIGKRYYFSRIYCLDTEGLSHEPSEFDEFEWANYDRAKQLINKIYQKGKQRIMEDVVFRLHDSLDLM